MATRKKTGGRKQGTQNKVALDTKEAIALIVNKELQEIESTLLTLSSIDRINTIIKLLPFVLPKQSEIKSEVLPVETENKPFDLSKLTIEELKILQKMYD